MVKNFFPMILLLLIVSCDTPPATGGQDPAAAAWNAAGTSTAAAVMATGTAVGAQSTRAAAEIAATRQAQATASREAAVFAATATEQGQLTSAAAIAIMTRDAIAADVLRMEATATAVAVQGQIAADMERAKRAADVAHFWHWFRWVALGAFAPLVLFGGYYVIRIAYIRNLPEDAAIYDPDGRPVAYHQNFRQLQGAVEIRPALAQPARPQPIFAERAGGASRCGALPAPNSEERKNINRWLLAVLQGSDFNRTTADAFGIGHDRADMLIKLAVRQGYAIKGEGQTSPVIPRDNFSDFVEQFMTVSPYSGNGAA